MQILVKKTLVTPDFSDFEKEAWAESDRNYYGKELDWTETHIVLTIRDENTARDIGSLRMEIVQGVAYIKTLIVAKAHRSIGVGTKLIQKAEEICRDLGVHQLVLDTGKTWGTVHFYEVNGFKVIADLPNYLHHVNFVLLSKDITNK